MFMKNNKEFKLMMRGGCGQFTQYELWSILSHQNELGINTIMVQKDPYGNFVCKVDKITTYHWLEEGKKSV